MTNGVMTIAIFSLVVLVTALAPRVLTPTALVESGSIEITPAATPEAHSIPIGNTFTQVDALTATPTHKVSPTPTSTLIPRRKGGGSNRIGTVSSDTPKIEIDDMDNKIKYQNFDEGNSWNISLRNVTTGALEYQFNGAIGEQDTDNNWFVWFGYIPSNEEYGIQNCIFPGSYNVYANASHSGIITEKNGNITVNSQEACRPPIVPAPELNPIILVLAGLLGILFISRKHRGNFHDQ
ncbi:Uncharacterised protein [uncultured archaeon]|nr:Uncharacterised protein [uncultured archaeon]